MKVEFICGTKETMVAQRIYLASVIGQEMPVKNIFIKEFLDEDATKLIADIDSIADERGTLVLEYPETGLHPSEHEGVLLSILALKPKCCYLQTHSEIMALKAISMVKKGEIPGEVFTFQVFTFFHLDTFCEAPTVSSQNPVRASVCQRTEIKIDKRGVFDRPWPKGFYPERHKYF